MTLRAPTSAAVLVLLALSPVPTQVGAQTTEPRPLTTEEAEAYQMGLELAFACSPRRHNRATDSHSTIRRGPDAMSGTAVHFRSIDGTYLVLEEYDEDLDGHCLVFGWFGGPIEPGRYRIGRLAMSTVEAQLDVGEHSFFSMSAVRRPDENAMLVVESGSLEIVTIEGDGVSGTFELRGFLVDGGGRNRTRDVTWAGSFRAVRGEA